MPEENTNITSLTIKTERQ